MAIQVASALYAIEHNCQQDKKVRSQTIRVLFVCMGNICRSPTAEGVFKRIVEQAGLADRVLSDSAGTHDYHIGEPPDPRAQEAAARRGYDLNSLRGRQVSRRDFGEFDYVLAMDETNRRLLERLCPPQHAHKLKLFMEFSGDPALREVPDPYYGGAQGFEQVLDLVEQASRGLLGRLRERFEI
jgi:protein-tyrosine phosphatase